jgi:8-oxo-dGTP diphosphatase
MIEIKGLDNATISPFTVTFLIDNEKVLTHHRAKDKVIYPDRIMGFGGKVEPGEDIYSSAKREFKEETGLEVKNIELKGTFIRVLTEKYFSLLYLFVANGYKGKMKVNGKEGKVAWMSIDKFLKHPKLVDHVNYYFNQILDGKNFYVGVGYYEKEDILSYQDSKKYFNSRKEK